MRKVRLILGDQLNYRHSWYNAVDPHTTYLIMEMKQETGYVWHHAQKLIGFFAAMYNFAAWLQRKGHHVMHWTINDPRNTQHLTQNIAQAMHLCQASRFEYQLPDEYRLDQQLQQWCSAEGIDHQVYDTEHFLTTRDQLANFFGKRTPLMESFYRDMRRRHGILMAGDQPEAGRWNFDADNRSAWKEQAPVPPALLQHHDYSSIWQEIERAGIEHIGDPQAGNFPWPTSRRQSLAALEYFIQYLLPAFGQYQDAMHTRQRNLFHSRLSFALNTKMLSPLEVIEKAEQAYRKGHVPTAAVEGFIRQILGWREYMRGLYWAHMPGFSQLNFFQHSRPLPRWYWTGKTRMNCLRYCITQSLDDAYAHHIQRLMITGNFALLAGTDPAAVDAWYLGIYIDAIEWVEITNTRGMSQFADGGITGTKPYVSSAAYIHRMSNYCQDCYYKHNVKTGKQACPFNSLYWDFFDRHRPLLENNPRIGMVYKTWDKMQPTAKAALLQQAAIYLEQVEQL
ncbi:cryptochrome/photolyase family protein [Paraflavitalea pollutisoli]|uniref:cryptochrome/photolyase family protein n=1 Tax=Paraflavitalea pollutisoli TaxID=3034143 RepID=UPI0023EDE52F|nr:cryptochrome/photolyase family protein [Paraflavitalea sp. H1-2-19X]